jgi:hypothetical protein
VLGDNRTKRQPCGFEDIFPLQPKIVLSILKPLAASDSAAAASSVLGDGLSSRCSIEFLIFIVLVLSVLTAPSWPAF